MRDVLSTGYSSNPGITHPVFLYASFVENSCTQKKVLRTSALLTLPELSLPATSIAASYEHLTRVAAPILKLNWELRRLVTMID